MKRRRSLMIAPAMPAAGGNGLAMRLGVFLEALAQAGEAELLVVPVAGPADAPPELPQRLGVPVSVLDLEGRRDTQLSLLLRLADPAARLQAFRAYGRPSLAGGLSLPVRAAIAARIERGGFDLVHVARLYLSDAASVGAGRPIRTIDLDDDDEAAFRGRAAVLGREGSTSEADWALAEADAFASMARRNLPCFDRVFAAAECALAPAAEIVPNCVAFPHEGTRADDGRTILFVGSLGYQPNADGLDWFLRGAWPPIRQADPRLRLDIVGADPPEALRRRDGREGISVHGQARDLAPFYRRAMLSIAPLRSGGGTRIKLIEAAAWQVPFVTTTAAVAGLAFGNGACWVDDDVQGFAAAVLAASRDPAERARRAANAHAIAHAYHDRDTIISRLAASFAMLVPIR